MAGGFKVQGNSTKFSVYKPSDGVNEKKYHTVLGCNRRRG